MKKVLLVIGAIIVAILAVVALGSLGLLGAGRIGALGPGMMRGFGLFGFGIRPLGIVLRLASWVLLLGGLVLVVVWLARTTGRSAGSPAAVSTPLDVLKERYARGEITKEQYEVIKRDIA